MFSSVAAICLFFFYFGKFVQPRKGDLFDLHIMWESEKVKVREIQPCFVAKGVKDCGHTAGLYA